MNEEQIEIVKSTWKNVIPIAETAADIFYDKLFEAEPNLRTLFPEEMTQQKKKLMQTLGLLVHSLENLESVLPAVEALGARHVSYGVKEEHYPKVGAALLAALEAGLGDAWTREAKEGWTAVYSLVSSVMIQSARKAAVA